MWLALVARHSFASKRLRSPGAYWCALGILVLSDEALTWILTHERFYGDQLRIAVWLGFVAFARGLLHQGVRCNM